MSSNLLNWSPWVNVAFAKFNHSMKLLALHNTYYTQESKGSLQLKSIRHLVKFQKLNDTIAVNEMDSF